MKYLVTGTISTQFEVEVEAESVSEAQILTYQKMLEVFHGVVGFSIKSIHADHTERDSIED